MMEDPLAARKLVCLTSLDIRKRPSLTGTSSSQQVRNEPPPTDKMAILPSIPSVAVSIAIEHAMLQEHANPEEPDQPRAITRYVEAVSNATFSVHVFVRSSSTETFAGNSLLVTIYADGQPIAARVLRRADVGPQGFGSRIEGQVASDDVVRPMKFAELKTGKFSFLCPVLRFVGGPSGRRPSRLRGKCEISPADLFDPGHSGR